jgi:beta-glucosidase
MPAQPGVEPVAPVARTDEHYRERRAAFEARKARGPIDVLFIGDSITRRWVEAPEIWEQSFGAWRPANFGVGSDTAANLLWRLENGDIDGTRPRVVVLLIGTNDAPTRSGPWIAAAVRACIDVIKRKIPGVRILLLAILPRGPQKPGGATPDSPWLMDVIDAANRELAGLENGDTVRFLDVGASLRGPDGEVDTTLMPDRLHLVASGYLVLANALEAHLGEMMRSP